MTWSAVVTRVVAQLGGMYPVGDHVDRLYRAAPCLCSSRKQAPELLELAPSIAEVEGLADKLPV